MCVSYCSKRCNDADILHKGECHELYRFAISCNLPMVNYSKEYNLYNSECVQFTPISDYGGLLHQFAQHISSCESEYTKRLKLTKWNNLTIAIGLLSYSMSLLYALQTIPGRRLGEDNRPLEDLTTLDIPQ